jgi:hypothetical protein
MNFFQEDHEFYTDFKTVLGSLPLKEVRLPLAETLREEWTIDHPDTSATLQERCRTLFLLSHIQPEGFIENVVSSLDRLDFSVKYPIQERYYAMLFYTLFGSLERVDLRKGKDLELYLLSKVFLYSFAGLSSALEIV